MKYLAVVLFVILLVVLCAVLRRMKRKRSSASGAYVPPSRRTALQPRAYAPVTRRDISAMPTQKVVVRPNREVLKKMPHAASEERRSTGSAGRRDDVSPFVMSFDDDSRGGYGTSECTPAAQHHVDAGHTSNDSATTYDSGSSCDTSSGGGGD